MLWLQPGWEDFVARATASIRRAGSRPVRRTIADPSMMVVRAAVPADSAAWEMCSRAAMHGTRPRPADETGPLGG
jgi:hypothetical protein